jgi:hypothetical protein
MKKTAILILIISLCGQVFAQGTHIVKGKVVEASSNRPVSYTNIGIEGTLLGTASDADGNFELKVPESMAGKEIYFSAVGYNNKQFSVNDLFTKEFNVIKLQSKSYGVGEIDVAAQNMVLIRILRMASENIKYNYGAGPFNIHFDYLRKRTVAGVLNQTNASVLLYDESGYSNPSKINAFKSRNYSVEKEASDDDYRFATAQLNIDELLAYDWVRSASCILNPGLINDYSLSLAAQPEINGRQYWEIAFVQKDPTVEASGDYYAISFSGKIIIDKDDYSVLKIEGEISSAKNNKQGRGLVVSNNNKDYYSDVKYSFKVDYEDVLLKKVTVEKSYTYNEKQMVEELILDAKRAHSNNLTKIAGRDYYAGE